MKSDRRFSKDNRFIKNIGGLDVQKTVFPAKYMQGVGAIGELPTLINLLGKQGLILASPSVNGKVLPGCGVDWSPHAIPIEAFRGECCENELRRLKRRALQASPFITKRA